MTKTPFSTDSQTNSRYGTGSKAEAGEFPFFFKLKTTNIIHVFMSNVSFIFFLHLLACELYSTLAPDTGIAWKILGGSSAGLGEFPWMVLFRF